MLHLQGRKAFARMNVIWDRNPGIAVAVNTFPGFWQTVGARRFVRLCQRAFLSTERNPEKEYEHVHVPT
jgi:hypothetical protein